MLLRIITVDCANIKPVSTRLWFESYSPYINHFISADTIAVQPFNPQSLNRYSYVLNNPLRYTDPTGHYACGDGEDHDCDGHLQDPEQNPHPPQPPHPPQSPKPDEDQDDDDEFPGVSLEGGSGEEDDNEYFCFTNLSSCDININPNAIVDPLAWTHIAEGVLGGVVLFGVGDLLIGAGAFVCTSVVGCIAGAPVILAGVLAYPVGVGFIYYGVQSGEIYLDEIIEVSIFSEG